MSEEHEDFNEEILTAISPLDDEPTVHDPSSPQGGLLHIGKHSCSLQA